jgi:hypothetical protein
MGEGMQTNVDPAELVQFIVWLASERDEALTPIRVVKFLYLADLYRARHQRGQTLTGWPWAFVHYGPYCTESIEALHDAVRRGLITVRTYQSKHDEEDHEIYSCEEENEPQIGDRLPLHVTGPLKGAVKRWADNTPGLLDHVYFETEPMLHALPGQRLDFSTARPPEREEPVKMHALSKSKLRNARELVEHLKQRYAQTVAGHGLVAEPRDDEYGRAMEILDSESLPEGLTGRAEIAVTREQKEE